ncbi:energy-coupled thiamine transporter ThiT [Williamsoniiplasma lucivorax]|uniref:Thiamine transporter n=1 Tax=Williamsoniiplasma lucivorax TaxID=209274 RepID=A0A2S5RFA0_9MOLU|nr:energy-coupled thiamine transporter ThiT [Williamsoniiplasma lucivorax]PPE05994.1 thiamine transporter [Williamsoniiplasma lucivorax]
MKIAFTKIEKPPLVKMGMGFAITFFLIMLSLLITFCLMKISWTNINDGEVFENIKTMMIMVFALSLAFSILIAISWILSNLEKIIDNKMQFILLSILSFNFVNIGILIYLFHKNKIENTREKITWKGIAHRFGFRKLTVYDVVLCGMFTALTITFEYVGQFLPQLPNGGGLGISYLPLITLAVVSTPILAIIAGGTTALIALAFIGNSYIISAWSYLLDYFIPMIIPGIVGFFKFKINSDKDYVSYVNFIIIGFFTFLGIYISQTLSGYFVWVATFGPSWGESGWAYSIIYNAISVWALAYPFNQVLMVPTIKAAKLASRYRSKR